MGNKKKVTLTLKEIKKSLSALINVGKKEGLDFKFNYRVAKICKKIEPIVKVYEESLNKFFKENGKYSKEDGTVTLNPKDEKLIIKFRDTEAILLNETHTIEFDKIPIEMFEEYDISSENIRNMMWMIEGEL